VLEKGCAKYARHKLKPGSASRCGSASATTRMTSDPGCEGIRPAGFWTVSWPGRAVMVGRDATRPSETLSFKRALEYLRAYTRARHWLQALMDANLDARGVRLDAVDYFHSGYHVWECD
jgi:hypothetical protein